MWYTTVIRGMLKTLGSKAENCGVCAVFEYIGHIAIL